MPVGEYRVWPSGGNVQGSSGRPQAMLWGGVGRPPEAGPAGEPGSQGWAVAHFVPSDPQPQAFVFSCAQHSGTPLLLSLPSQTPNLIPRRAVFLLPLTLVNTQPLFHALRIPGPGLKSDSLD